MTHDAPIVETPRIRLREFVEGDWRAMLAASGDLAMRYFDEAAFDEERARRWVAAAVEARGRDPRTLYALGVERIRDRQVLGYCDLVLRQPLECRMAYSGFRYVPSEWGKGYGTEALRALVGFGFDTVGLARISCKCEPENIGSWRVMERCGMRREGHGIRDDWSTKRNRPVSTYYYAITREEWDSAPGQTL